jgi:galactonate dehydratase
VESVRAFYKGWYNELVTTMPVISDLTVRRSNA